MVELMHPPRLPHRPRRILRQAVLLGSVTALHLFFISLMPPAARGDIYQSLEPDGTLSFTDVPTDSRFRKVAPGLTGISPRAPVKNLDRTIARHSLRHQLHPALLAAIIKAESDFDPTAVSKAGAVGLMQLMPQTARKLNVRDIYDPDENIGGGARLMRSLLDRFNGNLPLALAAYNAGADRVERYRTLPPIQETRRFVTKVLRFYRAFLFQEFLPQSRLSNPAYSARSYSLRDPAWDRGIVSRSEAVSKSSRSSLLCCLQPGRVASGKSAR